MQTADFSFWSLGAQFGIDNVLNDIKGVLGVEKERERDRASTMFYCPRGNRLVNLFVHTLQGRMCSKHHNRHYPSPLGEVVLKINHLGLSEHGQ